MSKKRILGSVLPGIGLLCLIIALIFSAANANLVLAAYLVLLASVLYLAGGLLHLFFGDRVVATLYISMFVITLAATYLMW